MCVCVCVCVFMEMFFTPGCPKGENFSSDVMRIVAQGQVIPAGGTPSHKHYSFIVKFLSGGEFEHTLAKEFGAPQRELITLSEIVPILNTFQKERGGGKYDIKAPEYIYGVYKGDEYLLMMQDLTETGYVLHVLCLILEWTGT